MPPPEITAHLILAELFTAWPGAVQVFLRRQMACPGCSMSGFETLAEAAAIYGITPAALLDEIQAALHHPTNPETTA
jgi:hybrid cluster-associated redox disulfide protein